VKVDLETSEVASVGICATCDDETSSESRSRGFGLVAGLVDFDG
jgi:hypothetical protein